MSDERPLSPHERWMVRSNLEHIAAGEDADKIIAILRARDYGRIADGVEANLPRAEVPDEAMVCPLCGEPAGVCECTCAP